ncbi:MAG: polysaccharide deacetylase family protein, partial [Pyrinomonadaceae bacterium]|nr:polysaccharide deacetylase family protein [Pyrinomonadaceae bacterium]
DDGYRNVYTEAFPILEKYGFGATVFLISDYCGKDNDWPGNSPAFERRPLLSWSEIEEMRGHGFEFGAHTATHPDLTRVSIQQAEREITGSKAEIEDRLGVEARCFAYPYGKYNSEVQEIVRTQFLGACSTILGKVRSDCDPHALSRIDTYYLSHPALFSALEADALEWYLGARQILRDLKARLI